VAAAYRHLIETRMLPNWWHSFGVGESLANELFFEFAFDGATIVGVIDRIGPLEDGGTRITDFKTGKADNAPKAAESLQLGIYYLAVQHSEELAPFRPVRVVELAYIQGGWRAPHEMPGNAWRLTDGTAEPYQELVEQELRRLIAEKRRLLEAEVYRPNPFANCRWCDFQTLCPLYPQGQEVFPIAEVTA